MISFLDLSICIHLNIFHSLQVQGHNLNFASLHHWVSLNLFRTVFTKSGFRALVMLSSFSIEFSVKLTSQTLWSQLAFLFRSTPNYDNQTPEDIWTFLGNSISENYMYETLLPVTRQWLFSPIFTISYVFGAHVFRWVEFNCYK